MFNSTVISSSIAMIPSEPLHVETTLKKSDDLSSLLNRDVYLKMECEQIPGSFKIRGIGHHSKKCLENGCTQLIGCSGGNAGIAVAYAAKLLRVPCRVYVPRTTAQRSIDLIRSLGAKVIVQGDDFNMALKEATRESKKPGNALIHAYDHPEIWEGHSTIIPEIENQLRAKPSVIIVSIGGGGLLCGILQGMEKMGWSDVPVLAMETLGAHCFNLSFKAKKIVPLEKITSIAKTLGARTIPQKLFDILPKFKIFSEVVSDSDAVDSCLQFAAHEGAVVEPSCGASLAAIYKNVLQNLVETQQLQLSDGPAVVIVCGGSGVTMEMLHNWAREMKIQ